MAAHFAIDSRIRQPLSNVQMLLRHFYHLADARAIPAAADKYIDPVVAGLIHHDGVADKLPGGRQQGMEAIDDGIAAELGNFQVEILEEMVADLRDHYGKIQLFTAVIQCGDYRVTEVNISRNMAFFFFSAIRGTQRNEAKQDREIVYSLHSQQFTFLKNRLLPILFYHPHPLGFSLGGDDHDIQAICPVGRS